MIKGVYKGTGYVEKEYFLELRDSDGTVTLTVVGRDGGKHMAGRLLSIDKFTGRVRMIGSINHDFGFELDDANKLIVDL